MRRALLVLTLMAAPVFAVQPDEILKDPNLEARARAITETLRCPVCQGESIDDSSAPISRDLRLVVRERLVAGDSDDQVIDYVTARYGEFVLFKPRMTGSGLALWLAGPLMLILGAIIAFVMARGRSKADEPRLINAEEQAELDKILRE
jgi:cytochrome c-type biogenesis protein CcmH